jgi:probable F420-dependent oxidoreductase
MKIGIGMIYNRVDDSAPKPGAFAQECEQMGFESVWVGDHTLFHFNPTTPFGDGGAIPEHYAHFPEPFVILAMAAAMTERLRFGTSVLLLPEHEPISTAKRIATLDRISGGRMILGVGVGWLREASEPLGSDFSHRWTQASEYVAVMRELWSTPVSTFHGKYVNFDGLVCNPKPVQQPGPPVLIGSAHKLALRWVARWGDGFIPVCAASEKAVSFMRKRMSALKEECDKVGRDFSTLDVTLLVPLNGERSQVQELLGQLDALGVHRVVELNSYEPFFAGDYRSKIERLAQTTL